MVALCQVDDRGKGGKRWHVSTLQLQLASLEFCKACRSVPTSHVRVDDKAPRTMWAARDYETQQHSRWQTPRRPTADSDCATDAKQVIPSRVPPVRAVSLLWTLGEKLWVESGATERWGGLELLRLSGGGCWSEVESLRWPQSLKALMLDIMLEKPARAISWPASLEQLSFGWYFNQPVTTIVWPDSLQGLAFEPGLNQPMSDVCWPASLKELSFGHALDQPFAGNVWGPPEQWQSVECLFDRPIADVVWPAGLQQLRFGYSFNQPITDVVWPTDLRRLSFGFSLNQPIDEVVWSVSLRQLSFGDSFNQPITGVACPASLQQLSCIVRRPFQPAHRGRCVAGRSTAAVIRGLVPSTHQRCSECCRRPCSTFRLGAFLTSASPDSCGRSLCGVSLEEKMLC